MPIQCQIDHARSNKDRAARNLPPLHFTRWLDAELAARGPMFYLRCAENTRRRLAWYKQHGPTDKVEWCQQEHAYRLSQFRAHRIDLP